MEAKINHLYAVLISLIVAIGGFLLGFDSAVISGATPFYKGYFNLPNGSFLIGFSVSSIILGAIAGNIIAGPFADRIGRKKVLIITSLLFTYCALGTALAESILFFVIARIVGGIGVGMAILVAPMYIAEIAPRKLRGTLVTFNQLNIVLGISIAYFSNYLIQQSVVDSTMNWRWMLGVGILPAALYFILLFIVPESPRWLLSKNRDKDGKKVLGKIGNESYADREYAEIKENLAQGSSQERAGFRELFSRQMKIILLIGFGIAFFQQITGINAIFYYAPMIFEMAGGGKDAAFIQAAILGITNVVMTIVAMFLIDRLGRKPLLIIGATGLTISLIIAGSSFMNASYRITDESLAQISSELTVNAETEKMTSQLALLKEKSFENEVHFFTTVKQHIGQENYNKHKETILKSSITINSIWVLIGLILYVASFAISLGPVMWALLSEIFPNKLRGLAISIVGFWNSIVSFSVATVFPVELEKLGSSTTYFIYALFGFLTILFVLRFIPETKGKSLEELEKILVKK